MEEYWDATCPLEVASSGSGCNATPRVNRLVLASRSRRRRTNARRRVDDNAALPPPRRWVASRRSSPLAPATPPLLRRLPEASGCSRRSKSGRRLLIFLLRPLSIRGREAPPRRGGPSVYGCRRRCLRCGG